VISLPPLEGSSIDEPGDSVDPENAALSARDNGLPTIAPLDDDLVGGADRLRLKDLFVTNSPEPRRPRSTQSVATRDDWSAVRRLLSDAVGGSAHPAPVLHRRRFWFLAACWLFAASPLVAWQAGMGQPADRAVPGAGTSSSVISGPHPYPLGPVRSMEPSTPTPFVVDDTDRSGGGAPIELRPAWRDVVPNRSE
jgi:hypothetical protein